MASHTGDKGTGTFIRQRVTGLLNIVLVGFLIWLVVTLVGADRAGMVAAFSNPVVALLALVLFGSAFVHMHIGMGEVIEDYVHEPRLHSLAKVTNTVFTLIVAAIAAISVLVLAFGGN